MLDERLLDTPPMHPIPETSHEGSDVAVKQFSFREMTYRRFMRHPTAKWAVVVLVLIAIACYGAPLWHAIAPNFVVLPDSFGGANELSPTLAHPFGTDQFLGHDIFSQVLWGGRLSLMIGIGSMVIATIIGVAWGAISGYFGGTADAAMMRVTDIFLTIPVLLTIPLASKVFGHADPVTIMLIFGLLSWPSISRIVRSTFLSLREAQFAEAARALGASAPRIIFRHLLPNSVGPIMVAFTLGIAFNIVLEAFVSFLGLGLQPPIYSWGSIMSGAQGDLVNGDWWWITFPGLALTATVLCINFIGDGLRDALDPKIID
jgi:peptide/nickel transport system permease protein